MVAGLKWGITEGCWVVELEMIYGGVGWMRVWRGSGDGRKVGGKGGRGWRFGEGGGGGGGGGEGEGGRFWECMMDRIG